MGHYFNSKLVKNKQQGWRSFIHDMFGPVNLDIADESQFFGEIRCAPLGKLNVTRIRSSYEHGECTKEHLTGNTTERFVFVMLKTGRLRITQGQRQCELSPGMFTLFNCTSPYVFHHTEPTDILDVTFPSNIIRGRLPEPNRFLVKAGSSECALGCIASDLLEAVGREVDRMPEYVADHVANQVTDMIGLLLENKCQDVPLGNSSVQSAIYRRATAFIECNLGDPELNPRKIAAGIGISVRYLHAIFRTSGESVGDFLRRRRISRSYNDLANAKNAHLQIKEVAYNYGFRNPAHFANAFKSQYGVCPSDVRSNDVSSRDA